MALTWKEFKDQASLFLSSSIVIGDDWEWVQTDDRPGFGFLAKRNVPREHVSPLGSALLYPEVYNSNQVEYDAEAELAAKPEVDADVDADVACEAELSVKGEGGSEVIDNDEATLQINDAKSHLYLFDYHIVYSPTYQQPVLYFNSHKTNGKLLTHDEVLYVLQVAQGSENHPFISQKEHPVLGIPFYHIHPCETSRLMKEVFANTINNTQAEEKDEKKINTNNYLLSWITIVAPVVGLRVPFLYYK